MKDLDSVSTWFWRNISRGQFGVKVSRLVNLNNFWGLASVKVVVAKSLEITRRHGHFGIELSPVRTSTSGTIGKGSIITRSRSILGVSIDGVETFCSSDLAIVDQQIDKGVYGSCKGSKVEDLRGSNALAAGCVEVTVFGVDSINLVEVSILKD